MPRWLVGRARAPCASVDPAGMAQFRCSQRHMSVGPGRIAVALVAGLGLSCTAMGPPVPESPWHHAADFTAMQPWDGAVCDPAGLEAIHCGKALWVSLLTEVCRHCRGGHCVSDRDLAKVAFDVLHIYTSMVVQHEPKVLTEFGCKHGLLAALLFHAEHVGFEFRPPQAVVEVVVGYPELDYVLGADDHWHVDAVMDQRFRAAGIPEMAVDPARLNITDANGVEVPMKYGVPDFDRFPLRVKYTTPPEKREFVNVRRHVTMDAKQVTLNINVPIIDLAPFPFHTARLRAMRLVGQDEYDQFAANISAALSANGILHVLLPGDSTSLFLGKHYSFLNVSSFLQKQFGLDANGNAPDTDGISVGDGVKRLSVFVPLELRERTIELFWGPGDGSAGLGRQRHAIELGVGHLQLGELPYSFARGVNYRIFCPFCLWISVYFYVTEATGNSPVAASVLPVSFWLPCRLPVKALFPARMAPLGSAPEVQVPYARDPPSSPPTLFAKGEGEDANTIYMGKCRESLLRAIARRGLDASPALARSEQIAPPSLPPVLPELLPMHDISSVIDASTSLDMLMALKQLHSASGLELYQDKIALSKNFATRGFKVPTLYYSSYDAGFDVRPVLRDLEARQVPYVAKASHMCCSLGVFVMDRGVDRVSGKRKTLDEIQRGLQDTFVAPFTDITPKCGDWGTVKAGETPGVVVEELMRPSIPVEPLLETLGGGEWITPDIVACHLVWSTLFHCVWEMKLRGANGQVHTEEMGMIFRDGSCLSCRYPMPFRVAWPETVALLEGLLPHADYLRITLFVKDGHPVVNEIEYTCGGLETVPVRIAQEWTLRWLEGYHQYRS
mmetsp:Transcript_88163/g.248054  ORF Transcript_88163/g.248054 Transcript_88163/m.248054 type:complete len:842 (+) Transcript_88163:118-2643(+)